VVKFRGINDTVEIITIMKKTIFDRVFTTTTNLFQIYYDKQVNNSSGGNDTR
jgi:hypothetical protein